MSSYSEGQTHQLCNALEAKGFTPGQVTALGQNFGGVLDELKLVILGLATIVRASFKLALDKVLNPAEFIGSGWRTWRGSADSTGLDENEPEDYIAEPDVVDFEQIILETHLQEKETIINGEEKMRRARASKNQQLGGKACLALWNDWLACKAAGKPEDSVLERLRRAGKIGNRIYFFGQTLRRPCGVRSVLYLYFNGGEWRCSYRWLDCGWCAGSPSVSLASVN